MRSLDFFAKQMAPEHIGGTGANEDRARLLWLVMLLMSLLALINMATIAVQSGAHTLELAFFAGGGLALALLAVAFRLDRVSYDVAATTTLAIPAALILERVLHLFLSGYFDDPASSFFMPVFAYAPLLYLISFVLLPVRRATGLATVLWLTLATLSTAYTLPYWQDDPVRSSLVGLMSFVWVAHGLFVVLCAASSRWQQVLKDSERGAREAMNQSEARFRSVFDLAAVGINVTDESGRYLMVNQGMVDMLGYTREELLERNFRSVTLPADIGQADQLTGAVRAGTIRNFRQEKRYVHKDGSVVQAEIFVRELLVAGAVERRFICVALDITERKRAEAQAVEDRRVRDFHFDNTPLGVVEFTPDLRIRRWSRRAERLFGWSEAEAVGLTAEELGVIPPEQVLLRRQRMDRMFRGEQDQYSAVVPMTHRNGQRRWLEVHNSVTRDAAGRVQTLIAMVLDITESREALQKLHHSEARFRSIFDQAAVGIALLDASGHCLDVNEKLREITGYSLEELRAIDFQTITHPDDLQKDMDLARAVIEGRLNRYQLEKRYIRKDGSTVWIMLFVGRIEATADTPTYFFSVIEDIDERKAAEARVKMLTVTLESQVTERTEQLREIIRGGQQRNQELTLIATMSQMLSAANDLGEARQVVTSYLPRVFPRADGALYLADAGQASFQRKVHWGEGDPGAPTLATADCWALRRGEIHHVEGEADGLYCPHVFASSHRHPHLCMPIQTRGAQLGLIELAWGRAADGWAPQLPLVKMVAEKIGLAFGNLRLREELRRQALIDPLTGLNNRRWLDDSLRTSVARHGRGGAGFAVLMIDVDHFKAVNDRHGHDAGDSVLREIGQALLRTVREGEALARYGGEEFTVVLDAADPIDPGLCLLAGERFRVAVSGVCVGLRNGATVRPTVSIGVAVFPLHGRDAQTVIEHADAALYQAKHQGRNRVSLHRS